MSTTDLDEFYFFTGYLNAFMYGIYGPTLGFTLRLGANSKQLVGLSGICIGPAEFLGNSKSIPILIILN